MPEPHRSAHSRYVGAYLRTGDAKVIGIGREVEGRRKDGSIVPIDLAVTQWQIAGKRFFTGIMRDISARKKAEEHVRLVMRELSHRTKNLLAVVQTMAWQTGRTSIDLNDFEQRFTRRVDALARSHELLVKSGWHGAALGELVRTQLTPFLDADARLAVEGPRLVLNPEAAQNIGLALHELATNASKYGALSCPDGKIEVSFSVLADRGADRLRLRWREIGGPEVMTPTRTGFGHTVIKKIMAHYGDVAIDFRPEGLVWQLTGVWERMAESREIRVAPAGVQ
jgi:two-component sensor histidine kinase